jgi:hypothetical protein
MEFFQSRNILAQKTHNAHGGAYMEGQFFNIDLTLRQRHTEKVQNVQRKSKADKESVDLFSAVIILFSEQPQHHCSCRKRQTDKNPMPKTKQCENLAAFFIRQQTVKNRIHFFHFLSDQ